MECPHCGEETLLGSLKCLSCGKSLLDDPALRDLAPVATEGDDAPPRARDALAPAPDVASQHDPAPRDPPATPAHGKRPVPAPPGFSEDTVLPTPRRTLAQMLPGAVDADAAISPPEAIPSTTEIPRSGLTAVTQEILAQRSPTSPGTAVEPASDEPPADAPEPPAEADEKIGSARTETPLWMQSQWQGDEASDGTATPSHAGGLPTVAAATEIFCRVCMQPFERPPDEDASPVCHMCLNLQTDGADLGRNEVQFHPSTAPDGQPDAFGQRLGSPDFRPRPVARERKSRSGLIVGVVGLLLTLACAAVIVMSPPPDRTRAFLEGTEPQVAEFQLTPGYEAYVELETKFRYHLLYAARKANFGTDLDPLVDIEQHTSQQMSVGFVREEGGAALSVVKSECFVDVQHGEIPDAVAADANLYPWIGHHATQQLLVPMDAPPSLVPEGEPVPGRDVAPFLTLGAIETPRGALQPEQTWTAEVRLPAFCDREGRLVVVPFDCTFRYVGVKHLDGHQCVVVRIENTAGPVFLPESLAGMNRKGGRIQGTIFFDLSSGFVVAAHLDVDHEALRHSGRTEERVHLAGQIELKRR